ncbi:MAG: hypothetical protein UHU19_08135 [Lachnospiraceae bacterium]|nr:hypothetical protein [Lachnospiraceae bacterium]
MSVFFRIKNDDCNEVTLSQLENGILEIIAPKNYGNAEIKQYLNDHAAELEGIEDKQKKATEVFRKKVKKMIDVYSEEFKLNFVTNLRLQVKTRKLNEGKVELHGILFNGNLSLMSATQFIPEEVVEKIVRYTIYTMACQYEQLWSEIKGFKVGSFKVPDIGDVTETHYAVEETGKYRITMPYDEIQKIQDEYKDAVKQFCEYMDNNPTYSFG